MGDSRPASMDSVNECQTGHKEAINDICYDFYGRRLATCSADKGIKVFDLDETTNEWVLSGEMSNGGTGHTGVVVKVAWAHPEFGTLLASCSEDHSVIVWKEDSVDQSWSRAIDLVDARAGVQDVKFAPHHMGLQLAAGSKDGVVRIYQARDPMKPEHWTLESEFEAAQKGIEVRCLSWNPSRFDTPMIVVGCTTAKEAQGHKKSTDSVMIWTFNESFTKWQSLPILTDCPQNDVWSVSWAPNMGRTFHYIACCSRDDNKHVRLWKIPAGSELLSNAQQVEAIELNPSSSQARRVEWNVSGSILATSGDDGEVVLWQCDHFDEKWVQISQHSAR